MTTLYEAAVARLDALKTADHQSNMTDNRYATSGRMDQAHKAIRAAGDLIKALEGGYALYTTREALGLSQKTLGRWINPDVKNMAREVRRWERGERPIPGTVRVLIKLFAQGIRPEHIGEEP